MITDLKFDKCKDLFEYKECFSCFVALFLLLVQLNSAVCHLPLLFMPSHGYVQQKAVSRALKIE